jgi:hypothetical protein
MLTARNEEMTMATVMKNKALIGLITAFALLMLVGILTT